MARIICAFTHWSSIVSDADRLSVVTDQGQVHVMFRADGRRAPREIVGMVHIRHGLVHALCDDGSVCQITGDGSAEDFQVQTVKP
jgi:hypothetical protein